MLKITYLFIFCENNLEIQILCMGKTIKICTIVEETLGEWLAIYLIHSKKKLCTIEV